MRAFTGRDVMMMMMQADSNQIEEARGAKRKKRQKDRKTNPIANREAPRERIDRRRTGLKNYRRSGFLQPPRRNGDGKRERARLLWAASAALARASAEAARSSSRRRCLFPPSKHAHQPISPPLRLRSLAVAGEIARAIRTRTSFFLLLPIRPSLIPWEVHIRGFV